MNRLGFVMLVLLLFGAHCFAIDFMGPPATELKSGQWKAGLIYSHSEQDIEVSSGTIAGIDLSSGTIDDVEVNRYYAGAAVGIWDGWELNGRLGAAEVETDVDDVELDGGTDFAWSWGTKITFASDEKIAWGALFQISSLKGDDNIAGIDFEIDAVEMQIAVGPTFKMEGWKLYGGPFICLIDGDLDIKVPGDEESFDLEEDEMVGAYIGAEIDIAKNTCLTVEVAGISGGWGAGAAIGWRF